MWNEVKEETVRKKGKTFKQERKKTVARKFWDLWTSQRQRIKELEQNHIEQIQKIQKWYLKKKNLR